MANSEKSKGSPTEVDFPITIRGHEFTLAYPLLALEAYEDETGETLMGDSRSKAEIVAAFEQLPVRQRMDRSLDLLWAGLITHHPEITRDDVRRMVFLRDLPAIEPVVSRAFKASLPDLEEAPAGKEEDSSTERPFAVEAAD